MEIHIKYTGIEPGTELKEYIQKRLKFLDKIVPQTELWQKGPREAVHTWVEIGKVTRHHQRGLIWYAECQLKMPGKQSIRATSTNYDLGAALDEVKEDLSRLLKKEREKWLAITKRGHRKRE